MSTSKSLLIIALILSVVVGCGKVNEVSDKKDEQPDSPQRLKQTGALRCGADVVGGISYVFEDPKYSGTYIGFEMEIANANARHMGVKQELVIRAWDSLIPELQKSRFDIAMNGI